MPRSLPRILVLVGSAVAACSTYGASTDVTDASAGDANGAPDAADGPTEDGGGALDVADAADAAPLGCVPVGDTSIVAYFPFDDGTGNKARDCSGNDRHGTIVGAPSWVAGRTNGTGALKFDGTSTCVDLGSATGVSLGTTAFTVATWINVATFPFNTSGYFIVSDAASIAKGWRLATDANDVFNVTLYQPEAGANFTVTSATSRPTGVWTHVAVAVEPGSLTRLYVNGALAASKDLTPSVVVDSAASTLIGCRAGANYLDATLADLRLYSRALDSNEIAALAQ